MDSLILMASGDRFGTNKIIGPYMVLQRLCDLSMVSGQILLLIIRAALQNVFCASRSCGF